jgi:ribosome biogenesis GTPase / thiamine phosphate phosphatase
MSLPQARVLATHGRQCVIQAPGGEPLLAVTRGRSREPVVGDQVNFLPDGDRQAVIESVVTRRNLLQRSEAHRSKALAANVDQLAIVLAPEPVFSEALVLRMMLAAHVENIAVAVIANKQDLTAAWHSLLGRLSAMRQANYQVFEVCAKHQAQEALNQLQPWMAGRCTVLAGQSGMGKSTLVNLLVPHAHQATQNISLALGTGKHTTTSAKTFALEHAPESWLIDTPGFQNFGLAHISASQGFHAMPEYASLARCRFNNCSHQQEPGCAIRDAAAQGRVDPERYRLFVELALEG